MRHATDGEVGQKLLLLLLLRWPYLFGTEVEQRVYNQAVAAARRDKADVRSQCIVHRAARCLLENEVSTTLNCAEEDWIIAR